MNQEPRKLVLRPCNICAKPGWCAHREPEIIAAEAQVLDRIARFSCMSEKIVPQLERKKSA